jgi:hypothetical protein
MINKKEGHKIESNKKLEWKKWGIIKAANL